MQLIKLRCLYAEGLPDVMLTLHFNHVEKAFVIPATHLATLVEVYDMLERLKLPGAVKCSCMQVLCLDHMFATVLCSP